MKGDVYYGKGIRELKDGKAVKIKETKDENKDENQNTDKDNEQ